MANYAPYSDVIRSITEPILKHIPKLPVELFFFLENKTNNGIFMPHGMADKTYHNPKRLNQIRHLLYSGPTWKQKLVSDGVPGNKIQIVGCPRLDPVFQDEIQYQKGQRARVVWAPTHNAIKQLSSYPAFEKYLTKLPDKYEVLSSVHPARRNNRETSLERLVNADVVLSDTSAVLYEAWAIGKPVILLDWLVEPIKGTLEAKIYSEGIGYHAKSFNELPNLVEHALREGIDRKAFEFIEDIFPMELRGRSGEVTANKLKELI